MKRMKEEEVMKVVKEYLLFEMSCEVEENKEDGFLFRRNIGNGYLYFKVESESRYLSFYIEMDAEIVYKSSKIYVYTYGLSAISKMDEILEFAKFFSFHYSKI